MTAWWRIVAAYMARGLAIKHKRPIRKYRHRRSLVDYADPDPNLQSLGEEEPIKEGQPPNPSCQDGTGRLGGRDPDKGIPLPNALIEAIAHFPFDQNPCISLSYSVRDTTVDRKRLAHTLAAIGTKRWRFIKNLVNKMTRSPQIANSLFALQKDRRKE